MGRLARNIKLIRNAFLWVEFSGLFVVALGTVLMTTMNPYDWFNGLMLVESGAALDFGFIALMYSYVGWNLWFPLVSGLSAFFFYVLAIFTAISLPVKVYGNVTIMAVSLGLGFGGLVAGLAGVYRSYMDFVEKPIQSGSSEGGDSS